MDEEHILLILSCHYSMSAFGLITSTGIEKHQKIALFNRLAAMRNRNLIIIYKDNTKSKEVPFPSSLAWIKLNRTEDKEKVAKALFGTSPTRGKTQQQICTDTGLPQNRVTWARRELFADQRVSMCVPWANEKESEYTMWWIKPTKVTQ